jgi:hypothetical protein
LPCAVPTGLQQRQVILLPIQLSQQWATVSRYLDTVSSDVYSSENGRSLVSLHLFQSPYTQGHPETGRTTSSRQKGDYMLPSGVR